MTAQPRENDRCQSPITLRRAPDHHISQKFDWPDPELVACKMIPSQTQSLDRPWQGVGWAVTQRTVCKTAVINAAHLHRG